MRQGSSWQDAQSVQKNSGTGSLYQSVKSSEGDSIIIRKGIPVPLTLAPSQSEPKYQGNAARESGKNNQKPAFKKGATNFLRPEKIGPTKQE